MCRRCLLPLTERARPGRPHLCFALLCFVGLFAFCCFFQVATYLMESYFHVLCTPRNTCYVFEYAHNRLAPPGGRGDIE